MTYRFENMEKFGKGWVVRYSIFTPCCWKRKAILIEQETKPTETQIYNEIINKGK